MTKREQLGGIRWMCTCCFAEGPGDWPEVCPACGEGGAWYSPPGNDPRPAKACWDALLSMFPPPIKKRH